MLSSEVRIQDIDGRQWDTWFRLLAPPGVSRERTWAAVIVDGGEVVRAVRSGRGAIPERDLPRVGTSPDELAAMRAALGVGAVFVIERDALARVLADVEPELRLREDFAAQWLTVARRIKALSGAGLWCDPPILDLVPIPPTEAVQRAFDLLVPDDTTIVAYVFDKDAGDVAASGIVRKRGGDVDLVTTHLALEGDIAARELTRSWRSQYRQIHREVERRFAPPSIGVFLQRDALARIQTGPTDQLSREVSAGNVILDPAPAWVTGLVGTAAAAAVAARGARALARFVPAGARKMASGWAGAAQGRLREAGGNPFALLGFDPWELWLRVRHFYRRE